MTDIMAAIGQVQLECYETETLPKRKAICEQYNDKLKQFSWAELPIITTDEKESSYHLFPLRIKNISEQQRDAIVKEIFDCDVSVNVHFIPLPQMRFYRGLGYDIKNYPTTFDNYSREISLPVFYDLTPEMITTVLDAVIQSVEKVLK